MGFLSCCREDVALSQVSTFGIGGPARLFIEINSVSMLQEAFEWSSATGTRVLVVGRGSNCLFSDGGFDGLVIRNNIAHCTFEESGRVVVGSGYSFSRLGVESARAGWKGLEFAAGIPGSVGGAAYMNAGANGQCTADVIHSVEYMNESGEKRSILRENIECGYRSSSFQGMKGAITAVTFQLVASTGALQRQKEMLEKRKKTQPYNAKSSGCCFRNPPGSSAGRLIEESGLKGACVGGAQVSTVHANFIVNTGNARSSDVLELMNHIRETVCAKSGIMLDPEVRIVAERSEE